MLSAAFGRRTLEVARAPTAAKLNPRVASPATSRSAPFLWISRTSQCKFTTPFSPSTTLRPSCRWRLPCRRCLTSCTRIAWNLTCTSTCTMHLPGHCESGEDKRGGEGCVYTAFPPPRTRCAGPLMPDLCRTARDVTEGSSSWAPPRAKE